VLSGQLVLIAVSELDQWVQRHARLVEIPAAGFATLAG